MSALPFSTTCRHSSSPLHSHSKSNIWQRQNNIWQLFVITKSNSRRAIRKLYVKNVASDKAAELKERLIGQGTTSNEFVADSASVASSIKYHAEFTTSFSPEKFEPSKAYFATAESVRDSLIINWNATYEYYERVNVKQAYYMSMEYLQGRALLNAIGNLQLSGPYAEALRKLGYNLEDVANQEPDAALGNGGLGRLASCFLDSLATLNYPAWGYGLRYRYGLFKQRITKDGQEEVAENWLEVIFVPDYNVSVAEMLIPGSELSQHISTAGMEASGTSNMKFAMNGCVQIGTLDGANVEIREEVGEDNFFLFGARAQEIAGLRKERAEGKFVPDPRFEEVKAYVRSGVFGTYNYDELMGSLEGNEGYGRADYFLVGKDFPSYLECQEEVDKAYRDQKKWTRMSILNTAGSYKFSSDRTIHEYARDIWRIEPVVLP